MSQITAPFLSSMGLAAFSFPHWLLLSVAGTKITLLPFSLLSSADLSAVPNSAESGPHVWKDISTHNPLTVVGSVGLPATLSLGKKEDSVVFQTKFLQTVMCVVFGFFL